MRRLARILAALTACLLCPPCIPPAAAAETGTYELLTYESSGSAITITDCTIPAGSDDVVLEIPAAIDGLPVTAIGDSAFAFCEGLTAVILPDSIVTIDDYAFYCCEDLTSIFLPEGVTDIGSFVFASCKRLPSIHLPSTTGLLYAGSFSGCTSLAEIQVAEGNRYNCSIDGVLYGLTGTALDCDIDETWLNCYPPAKTDTSYTVPAHITSIERTAFDSCQYLQSLTLPEGLLAIAEDAFYGCTALEEVEVPDTCIAASSADGVLYSKDGAKLLLYPAGRTDTHWTVPANVTAIAPRAFSNAVHLTEVTLPEGLEVIEQHLFSGCTSLTTLHVPASAAYFSFYALYDCTALTDIVYAGTQAEWQALCTYMRLYGYDEGNDVLQTANVTCLGEPAVSVLLGDLNADAAINAVDSSLLLIAAAREAAGLDADMTDAQRTAADVNTDGNFNAVDASLILQYAAYAATGGKLSLPDFLGNTA